MFSIETELRALIGKLHAEEISYALCGALALAVYGYPRATLDIDLVALAGSAARIQQCARALGFTLAAAPMQFAGGRVQIERICKVPTGSEDIIMLDILLLAPEIEQDLVIEDADWLNLPLRVVSRASLVRLKELRSSAQDLADIEKLSP